MNQQESGKPECEEARSNQSASWLSVGAEVLRERTREADRGGVHCDVLIVGSGYGAAVAAARLAGSKVIEDGKERGVTVWVLERGEEYLPGRFPSRFSELPGHVRFQNQEGGRPKGRASGLFDFRLGKDVHALVANGLGGGSLINAAVMERPEPRIFQSGWPQALRWNEIEACYAQAEGMLGVSTLPNELTPNKLKALECTAKGGNGRFQRARMAVNFNGSNLPNVGVHRQPCIKRGDCVAGCNQGAKNSLDTNYLAWARARGAEIFCGGWVEKVLRPQQEGQYWEIDWHYTDQAKRPPDGKAFRLRARKVILAAGSLGSTEILLRSAAAGLTLAKEMLGQRFSTNGDLIAAGYRQSCEVNATADEDNPFQATRGPTITGLIKVETQGHRFVVEEFGIPASLRRVMGEVTTTFGLLHQFLDPGDSEQDGAQDEEDPLAVNQKSLDFTSIYGFVGEEEAKGEIKLLPANTGEPANDGKVRIDWKDLRDSPLAHAQIGWLTEACKEENGGPGGTVIPLPTWMAAPQEFYDLAKLPKGSAFTVHPLGGCPMGNCGKDGVVDLHGCVFKGEGAAVYENLVVLDGSIIPKALGINPSLTIAALAELAMPTHRARWGYTQNGAATGELPARPELIPARDVGQAATAIKINEMLRGKLKLGEATYDAEIEVHFQEIPDLAGFLKRLSREVQFHHAELRLYQPRDWVSEAKGEERRHVATLPLSGKARIFHRPEAQPLDAIWRLARPWYRRLVQAPHAVKRGVCALVNGVYSSLAKKGAAPLCGAQDWKAELASMLVGLDEQRLMTYTFSVSARPSGDGKDDASLKDLLGADLVGTKIIGFAEGANPWRQMTELTLEQVSGQQRRHLGRLTLDLGHLVKQRKALLSITGQRDQPNAIADLASLGLYVLRLLIGTQLQSFMPPGDMPQRMDERKPGTLDGVTPEVFDLDGGARLSRYLPRVPKGRPVMMIHGYGASGSTFAHPSIPKNLVRFMLEESRDVWVLDLRTSIANLSRTNTDDFDTIARGDIPAALTTIHKKTNQQIDLIAHCIGAAMFCTAALEDSSVAAKVGAAVLSQVGPMIEMSPMNLFRAYLASYLKEFLALEEFDVRPEYAWRAGRWERKDESLGGLLLDMLLATYPYPEDDAEAVRAADLPQNADGSQADFRRVRHRADAIYGQLMQLGNVADETLLALDAIYGWVKVQTLAQTIFFARRRLLTDASGRNRSIHREKVASSFNFPVLLLHGRHNRVFDWRGSKQSFDFLKAIFDDPNREREARAPAGDLHLGAGTRHQLYLFGNYGHQDSIIGKNAHKDVYPVIAAFLEESLSPSASLVKDQVLVCEPAWVGPTLGWIRGTSERVTLSLLVHPTPRRADVLGVVIIPLRRTEANAWRPNIAAARLFARLDNNGGLIDQGEALYNEAITVEIATATAASVDAFAVLTLHGDHPTPPRGETFESRPGGAAAATTPLTNGCPVPRNAAAAVADYFVKYEATGLDQTLFHLDQSVIAERDLGANGGAAGPICFALASCQYPPGLFDAACAGASYRRLLSYLELPTALKPQFLALIGDQIYADATAGLFDPSPGDLAGRLKHIYELNWRLDEFRAVTARLPTYFMLDDHEVNDNWQPQYPPTTEESIAIDLYWRFQGKLNPTAIGPGFAYKFWPAGWPFFVLDTRTQRQDRRVGTAVETARIIPREVMDELKAWLSKHREAPAKFIVSPSVVLPLERFGSGRNEERIRIDGWSGYPASLCELLNFIAADKIQGVVFLCGDAHLSLVTKLVLGNGENAIYSIVSSGLHSPWPFANTRPADYVLNDPIGLECATTTIAGQMSTPIVSEKNGYAVIGVRPFKDSGRYDLTITLQAADGSWQRCSHDLANPTDTWSISTSEEAQDGTSA